MRSAAWMGGRRFVVVSSSMVICVVFDLPDVMWEAPDLKTYTPACFAFCFAFFLAFASAGSSPVNRTSFKAGEGRTAAVGHNGQHK